MRLRNMIMLGIFVILVGYFLIFPVLYHRINSVILAYSGPPKFLDCKEKQGWYPTFSWEHDTWSCVKK